MCKNIYSRRLLNKSVEKMEKAIIKFHRKNVLLYFHIIWISATITMSGCNREHRAEPPPPEAPPISSTTEIMGELGMASDRLWDSGKMSTLEWEAAWEGVQAVMPVLQSTPDVNEQLLTDIIKCTDMIHATAKKHSVDSIVMVKTDPKRGATIRYQTYGSRYRGEEPMTAKGLSPCKERMPIGWYYFWSERKGKPTSNRSYRLRILDPEEEVEIEEIQSD